MSRTAYVPEALRGRPFSIAEAASHGLSEDQLRGSQWERLGGGRYAHRAISEQVLVRFGAALSRLPPEAAISGRSAALMHGVDLGHGPIEVTIPKGIGISARAGIALRRSALPAGEVVPIGGIRVTSAVRTFADVARSSSAVESVVALDTALQAGAVEAEALAHWAAGHPRHPGIKRLRRALELAEPAAESPMETRLRLLLVVRGGLPRPQVQVSLFDSGGRFLGRPDLYYPDQRLGLEYDGSVHRDSLNDDNRRQNALLEAGYRLLRFTSPDVYVTPDATIALVRATLQQPVPALPRFNSH